MSNHEKYSTRADLVFKVRPGWALCISRDHPCRFDLRHVRLRRPGPMDVPRPFGNVERESSRVLRCNELCEAFLRIHVPEVDAARTRKGEIEIVAFSREKELFWHQEIPRPMYPQKQPRIFHTRAPLDLLPHGCLDFLTASEVPTDSDVHCISPRSCPSWADVEVVVLGVATRTRMFESASSEMAIRRRPLGEPATAGSMTTRVGCSRIFFTREPRLKSISGIPRLARPRICHLNSLPAVVVLVKNTMRLMMPPFLRWFSGCMVNTRITPRNKITPAWECGVRTFLKLLYETLNNPSLSW